MRISDWSSDVCSSDLFQREQALIKRQHQFHPKTVRARGEIAIRLEPHPEMGAIPELLRQTERLPRLARRRIKLLVSAANLAPATHGYANLPLVPHAASRGRHGRPSGRDRVVSVR